MEEFTHGLDRRRPRELTGPHEVVRVEC
jgi:hypothetical protein